MAITPADIEQQTFSPSKHGYDTEEVDAFLEQISSEVDAMLQKIADLKGRLNNTEQQLAAANAQIASLEENAGATQLAAPAPVVAPTPAPAVDLSVSERQISQVLIVAQQSADKLVAEARDNAERIRNEADQKAREVIRQALAEKQNELDEIDICNRDANITVASKLYFLRSFPFLLRTWSSNHSSKFGTLDF